MMKRGHDVESAPSIWRRRTAMEHYAGIDVSLELSSVCVVDAQGKIVKEAKVASEPEAVVAFFEALGFAVKRIGLEAGPLSQWLHAGLKEAGFETVLLETRHVKAALSAMTVKTDRKDARGLAQLLRMGWFQQVHAKAMLSARAALKAEYEKLHQAVLAIVREDAVCRRLMTVPSVGPLVAITYKSALDDPSRIAKSKAAGALFGLTPKKYQSGEKDVTGGITRTGDEMVRTALYEAANVLLSRITRFSKLKRWGMDVAKRRGSKRAKVALARKIGIILHRMWIDGTTYRWAEAKPIAAQA